MKHAWVALASVSLSFATSAIAQTPWDAPPRDVPTTPAVTTVDVPACRDVTGDAVRDVFVAALRAETRPTVTGNATSAGSSCGYHLFLPAEGTAPAGADTAWSRAASALSLAVARHPDAPIVAIAQAQQSRQRTRWRRVARDHTIDGAPFTLRTSLWFAIDADGVLYATVHRAIEHGLSYGAGGCEHAAGHPCDPVGPIDAVGFEVHDITRLRVELGGEPRIVQHRVQRVGPLHRPR